MRHPQSYLSTDDYTAELYNLSIMDRYGASKAKFSSYKQINFIAFNETAAAIQVSVTMQTSEFLP